MKEPLTAINLMLLAAAILLVLNWVIPPANDCYIPPSAPIRGFYSECWNNWELWA